MNDDYKSFDRLSLTAVILAILFFCQAEPVKVFLMITLITLMIFIIFCY